MSEEVVALASKTFGDVTATVFEFVGTAEICRPPHNFFDAELIGSLADAFEWLDEQRARAIVLASAGKNFCAGADFSGRSAAGRIDSGGGAGAGDLYEQALRLFRAPLPVVAAVQGAAVGGGLGLACAADFRVACPQSRFSANFARIGLHQGFALSVTLPAIVGQQRAAELLYTGKRIGGEDAAGHRPGRPARRRGGAPGRRAGTRRGDRVGGAARGAGDQGHDAGRSRGPGRGRDAARTRRAAETLADGRLRRGCEGGRRAQAA